MRMPPHLPHVPLGFRSYRRVGGNACIIVGEFEMISGVIYNSLLGIN